MVTDMLQKNDVQGTLFTLLKFTILCVAKVYVAVEVEARRRQSGNEKIQF